MLREAESDLVLSLDDDSYPEQSNCVEILKKIFDTNPRLAVAHFPQRSDEYPDTLTREDFGGSFMTGSFANSGACYRRRIYLALNGFPKHFFHSYEEPDYALQVIAAGKDVLFFTKLIIRHHFSLANRNEIRVHQRHARNEFLSALVRCPFPLVLLMLPYRVFSQARYAASRGLNWLIREPIWWLQAVRGIKVSLESRSPVSHRQYLRWIRLMRRPIPCDIDGNSTIIC